MEGSRVLVEWNGLGGGRVNNSVKTLNEGRGVSGMCREASGKEKTKYSAI